MNDKLMEKINKALEESGVLVRNYEEDAHAMDEHLLDLPDILRTAIQDLLTSEVEKERERLLKEVEKKIKEQRKIIKDEMTGNQEASGYYVSGVSRMENGVRKALSEL